MIPQGQIPQAAPQKIRAMKATPRRQVPQAAPEQVQAAQGGDSKKAAVPVANGAQVQAFKPGDKIEYCSKSTGGQWISGMVQSFNPQSNTYCLNFWNPQGQVPQAKPKKMRAAQVGDSSVAKPPVTSVPQSQAFISGDKVEQEVPWTTAEFKKWLQATISSQGWLEIADFEVWPEEKKIPSTRKNQSSNEAVVSREVNFADEKGLSLASVHLVEEVKRCTHPEYWGNPSVPASAPPLSPCPNPSVPTSAYPLSPCRVSASAPAA
jgi:hypothetical protein